MSVQGEIIRITEAKTDIASAINEQGYTLVDEDASISTYADAIRANTNSIKTDLSGYLPLSGGTLTGDLNFGSTETYINSVELVFPNGGIACDDYTYVNFYGFDSSLSFDEGGYSSWTSPKATILSDEVTIKGLHYDGARLCFYSEYTSISAFSDNTLTIGSPEAIWLNADRDGIYLNAPSISLNSLDISASGGILASGFLVTNSSDDYVLLGGGATKLLSEITAGLATENYVLNKIAEAQLSGGDIDLSGLATKDDLKNYASISALAGYLPLTGGSLTGDLSIAGTVSFLYPGTGGYVPLIHIPALGGVIGFNGDDGYIELNHNHDLPGVRIDGRAEFKQETDFQNGFTVGTTSCLFGGTSTIGEYDYTHEDESTEHLFEICSDYPIMLHYNGDYETIFRLTGDGASINNPISVHHGTFGAVYGSSKMYFNNGGIDCTEPDCVSFYGFNSNLMFNEEGGSIWSSDHALISTVDLTLSSRDSDQSTLYFGANQLIFIGDDDDQNTLRLYSPGEILMSNENCNINIDDIIYLNGGVECLENVTATGFAVNGSSNDYILLAGGGTKAISDFSNEYLPLTGGTMTGAIDFSCSNNGIYNLITINDSHYLFQFENSFSSQSKIYLGADTSVPVTVYQLESQTYVVTPKIKSEAGAELTFGTNTITSSNSTITATAFFESSDIRKKDIKSDISLDKCYDLIEKCQTIIYSLKSEDKEQMGMIAQEVEEFFPEVVATDEEGFKSLAYDRLVVICFKVLKDVIKRLEKLEQ